MTLPYGRQVLDEEDVAEVIRVLRSDFLTCGPEVDAFEREFAEFVGAKHAVAVCNATAALHLALLVADIGPGDRVVTSPNTFLASANCAAYVGARPDFCDIDRITHNLDPAKLEDGWKQDTKAVIAVDYAGLPCDMPEISRIARSKNAVLIEDACHGAGGGFCFEGKNWKLGGHPWADITVFSFHPVKTMTTGEGGMMVTDNSEWAAKARRLRAHGMTRDASSFCGLEDDPSSPTWQEQGPWYYEMQELGYNYRITDIQCALGRSQLRKLPGFIKRRQEIVAQYNREFANAPFLETPRTPSLSTIAFPASLLSWHLYTVQIDFAALGIARTRFMTTLRHLGVGSQVLYIPVHLQPWYRKTYGYSIGMYPVAEKYYSSALSLPLFPAMTDNDVNRVVSAVKNILNRD